MVKGYQKQELGRVIKEAGRYVKAMSSHQEFIRSLWAHSQELPLKEPHIGIRTLGELGN